MSIKEIILGPYIQGSALKKMIGMTPQDIIEDVKASKIKGRGGAGFPTGLKWQFAASEEENIKYVICNADEGEPGTFKDRLILSEYPKRVIEGIIIAGYAIRAKEGFIYLRAEYRYLKKPLESIMQEMRDDNLLGKNILGSDFSFDITIRMGAGAYVCGEEFALIESMNGYRGEPHNKPPFPTQRGYLRKPTVVNNVETLAKIPFVITMGAEAIKYRGTLESTGTKLFSVSGDVKKPGVYEVDMGITVNDLLKIVGGEDAKAVQVGGASGINVARKDFDKSISYEGLPPGGSIIVFGPDRDMLKVLKNFMEFFAEESCGQCTPCRDGNYRLLEGVKMMEKGECSVRYFKELELLCEVMKDSSKCGLGQTSPNPFVTIIKNFRSEILYR